MYRMPQGEMFVKTVLGGTGPFTVKTSTQDGDLFQMHLIKELLKAEENKTFLIDPRLVYTKWEWENINNFKVMNPNGPRGVDYDYVITIDHVKIAGAHKRLTFCMDDTASRGHVGIVNDGPLVLAF